MGGEQGGSLEEGDAPAGSSAQTRGGARSRRPSRFDRPKPPHDWRWVVGGIGRVLIALGILMFGFVAYQLWGTALQTAAAQNHLENDFEELVASMSTLPFPSEVTATAPSTTLADTTAP